MIKRLINKGFKDQTRTVEFSGLDLITSNDVNGVGKSAVLEAFKLALMGEISGRAKNVEDILEFTSREEMHVGILADTSLGPVAVERRFLRHAPRGEKRPVIINRMITQYEEGSQWIRRHIGAVSICFDPFEFLNLSDAKKRQWIIAHSPESRGLDRSVLYAFLLGRMVEQRLGSGILHSILTSLAMASLDDIFGHAEEQKRRFLEDRLVEVFEQQEPALCRQVLETLDAVFRYWSESHSAAENNSAMLKYLKSESLRLKNSICDQTAALNCMSPQTSSPTASNSVHAIPGYREEISSLVERISDLDRRMENIRIHFAIKNTRQERVYFLQENISRLTKKLKGDMSEALKSLREQLHNKRVDPMNQQEKLKQLNLELSQWSAECQEKESGLKKLAFELKLKGDKLESLGSCDFVCPVGSEIRCDTDMAPYQENLVKEIELLQREEAKASPCCEKARQKVADCQHQIHELDDRLANQLGYNREIQREIDLVDEQIHQEENETAQDYALLKAYREEWSALESEPVPLGQEEGGVEILQEKKNALKLQMDKVQKALDECLREQGKTQALFELKQQKQLWEQKLKVVKQLFDLLGGIQREMAVRIAGALETEVNDVLKLIDSDYHFTLNLSGKRFEMGWNRGGKIIPFKTINSAHFIIFIVPFLAALMKRLARMRKKSGLPTLKALCIEAESLTPTNLMALLRGLANMKERGALDNVLVAHYHSLRDREKLSGFQEHILQEMDSHVLL